MAYSQDMNSLVEQNSALLGRAFMTNINSCFFTEKELHAHFYHLSMTCGALYMADYEVFTRRSRPVTIQDRS